MSSTVNGSGELVVVTAVDETTKTLSGRDNLRYTSPPQPREAALTLVELLLGRRPVSDDGWWRCAIAGGRRTITLEEPGVGDAQP